MPTSREKLADSLSRLEQLQADGSRVFQSGQFKRTDRQRLVKHGFLQHVIKGWLISVSPQVAPGDTTPWFASFWEFCRRYCSTRFSDEWHLSPQQSLDLHAEKSTIPVQVVVHSPRAQNNLIRLPSGTSLYGLKQKNMPPAADLTTRAGLRLFCREAALIRVPESYYTQAPTEAEVVITSIQDPSDLLKRLLSGGHTVVAGRLAGAFRRLGRGEFADEINAAMRSADYNVRETDPFHGTEQTVPAAEAAVSLPIIGRLERLWASGREAVLEGFPEPPEPRLKAHSYLAMIDDIYQHDAYHSLSIEGYRVTPELVQRVASGDWNPQQDESHRRDRDALAARGYYQAFGMVRGAVEKLYLTEDPTFVRAGHRGWYRELFSPHVAAGLLDAAMLAGYRNSPVFLLGSRHLPPRWEILTDCMPALFDLIEAEPHTAVRAVLGHWLLGYIHPFPDGNGRIARLLMNALLATAGYPWTVIRVQQRQGYLEALERASVAGDVDPFVAFVAEQMRWSEEMVGTR